MKLKNLFLNVVMLNVLAGLAFNLFAANVGVIDADDKDNDSVMLVETIQALGHQAETIPEEYLSRPTGLGHYDCIILAHRSGILAESGYKILAEYVNDGGTLLITGAAAYWMKTPGGPRDRIQIRGAGPLQEAAGTVITGAREMPIKRLIVKGKAPGVMGLPEAFELKTTPPYDINNPAAWRYCGAIGIKAVSATPLIMMESIDAEGKTVEGGFLTVNKHGRGQCYRLALSRMIPLMLERKEKNIILILQNILRSAEDN